VYPCVEPTDALLEVLPLISGEMEAHVRGRGSDLYLIRDYAPEDTARHVDWKASARYDFNDRWAVRGTASTGFRAPGVQQAFFTLRSTNLDASGTLADTLTAANNSPVAKALGIPQLQEETANNYSLGVVARPSDVFRVTVDAYRIDIDDRIVFSDAVSAGIPAVGAILTPLGIGQVQFFTNAIEVQLDGAERADLGCIVVNEVGQLCELEVKIDFGDEVVDIVQSRDETLKKLDDLHPRDEIILASNALNQITELLLERAAEAAEEQR